MSPEAQLPPVYPFAAELYQRELATLQQQSPDVSLREVSKTHPFNLSPPQAQADVLGILFGSGPTNNAGLWEGISVHT